MDKITKYGGLYRAEDWIALYDAGKFDETATAALYEMGWRTWNCSNEMVKAMTDKWADVIRDIIKTTNKDFSKISDCLIYLSHFAPAFKWEQHDMVSFCHLENFDIISDWTICDYRASKGGIYVWNAWDKEKCCTFQHMRDAVLYFK